jgi:hypothetical protein
VDWQIHDGHILSQLRRQFTWHKMRFWMVKSKKKLGKPTLAWRVGQTCRKKGSHSRTAQLAPEDEIYRAPNRSSLDSPCIADSRISFFSNFFDHQGQGVVQKKHLRFLGRRNTAVDRTSLYLTVTTQVSCKFSLKSIGWTNPSFSQPSWFVRKHGSQL